MNHNIKERESKKRKTSCLCKCRAASFPQGQINKQIQVWFDIRLSRNEHCTEHWELRSQIVSLHVAWSTLLGTRWATRLSLRLPILKIHYWRSYIEGLINVYFPSLNNYLIDYLAHHYSHRRLSVFALTSHIFLVPCNPSFVEQHKQAWYLIERQIRVVKLKYGTLRLSG